MSNEIWEERKSQRTNRPKLIKAKTLQGSGRSREWTGQNYTPSKQNQINNNNYQQKQLRIFNNKLNCNAIDAKK